MARRTITHDELVVLCKARDTLRAYCEADECEKCIVTNLIDDAYSELEGLFEVFRWAVLRPFRAPVRTKPLRRSFAGLC